MTYKSKISVLVCGSSYDPFHQIKLVIHSPFNYNIPCVLLCRTLHEREHSVSYTGPQFTGVHSSQLCYWLVGLLHWEEIPWFIQPCQPPTETATKAFLTGQYPTTIFACVAWTLNSIFKIVFFNWLHYLSKPLGGVAIPGLTSVVKCY